MAAAASQDNPDRVIDTAGKSQVSVDAGRKICLFQADVRSTGKALVFYQFVGSLFQLCLVGRYVGLNLCFSRTARARQDADRARKSCPLKEQREWVSFKEQKNFMITSQNVWQLLF